jgi:hypothetical protein
MVGKTYRPPIAKDRNRRVDRSPDARENTFEVRIGELAVRCESVQVPAKVNEVTPKRRTRARPSNPWRTLVPALVISRVTGSRMRSLETSVRNAETWTSARSLCQSTPTSLAQA